MSKISKSIVISEFLWLLFFAVVFLTNEKNMQKKTTNMEAK